MASPNRKKPLVPPPRNPSPSMALPPSKAKPTLHTRTRSRSANAPSNRHKMKPPTSSKPAAPPRSKSRGRLPENKKKELPEIPQPRLTAKSVNAPPKPEHVQTPKTKPPNGAYPTKTLPPSTFPSRNRAATTGSHKANVHQLPAIGFNEIDESPILKPHNSPKLHMNNNSSNHKKALPPPNRNKKPKKKGVVIEFKDDEKQQTNADGQSGKSKRVPPSRPPARSHNAHARDYSIVKSIPSIFKTQSMESNHSISPRKATRNTRQFGLKSPKGSQPGFASMSDERPGLISASCQCGGVEYELLSLPQELQHCYCSMCRKMHGAAVATWTPMIESNIRFMKYGQQSTYQSSDKVVRSFCSVCGSNISLKYVFQSDTIWMTPSLFNGASKDYEHDMDVKAWWLDIRILHIFCASKCEWYEMPSDGHPQLSEADIHNTENDDGEPVFMYDKQLPPKPGTGTHG
eukprot:CAMPEP_0197035352 /NCGR_PEP_ID=MMETSP1384-20130603/13186_1 /TAXON_ID=29189 /ORGANISM="Ammonia sp." /LENGTH=458 /DNA_ID=CAMNT_0042465411 /DNA_START=32 /DNA_END=1408 /DNA_ORIENTATION=+